MEIQEAFFSVEVCLLSPPGSLIEVVTVSCRYVEERSFKRFAEACLEDTIVMYVDRLLIQVWIFILQGDIQTFVMYTCWFSWYYGAN